MFRRSLHPSSYPILPNDFSLINRRPLSSQRYSHRFLTQKLHQKVNQGLSVDNCDFQRINSLNVTKSWRPSMPKLTEKGLLEKRKKNSSNAERALGRENKQNINVNVKLMLHEELKSKPQKFFLPQKVQRKLEDALNMNSISYVQKPSHQRKVHKNPYPSINAKFTESVYYKQGK